VSLAVLTALVVASSASSTPRQISPFAHSATVAVSPQRAGARDVTLTLVLRYEMQCGYPGSDPIAIDLPTAELVPAHVTRGDVVVDGKSTAGVIVDGHTVRVLLAPPPAVMCDEIGPGSVKIVFTPGAGLTSPARSGAYTVEATRGGAAFSARFAIF
jgi:hypothetical protein